VMRAMSPRPESRFDSLRALQDRLVVRSGDDVAGDPANAAGRCIALGTVAGSLFAYFDSLSLGWLSQASYPSAIAVGIGTAAMVEFCETFLRSKDRAQVLGVIIASVIWIGLVLVLSQQLTSL